jgi:uncharacterized protein
MWKYLVRLILRNRLGIVIVITLLTGFMAYNALNVKFSYELARMLPASDSSYIEYETFKNRFGEDGNVFTIGIENKDLFKLEHFNALYNLCADIKKMDGVEEVVSVARTVNLIKNDSTKKFEFEQLAKHPLTSQAGVDSIKNLLDSLPFYNGLLFNKEAKVYLVLITLDRKKLNDKSREKLIVDIYDKVEVYKATSKTEIHYSGLPYIRTMMTKMIKKELIFFIILSLAIAMIIMVLFFKSSRVVLSSLILVFISIIWTLGTISLFDYKISVLTGVIPSLLVIIAIENCIYLINKYHWEYKTHSNKVKALSRVVQRIGRATLMTNLTTATGFATFIFTSNAILKEFGVVASINVMVEFIMSVLLIPVIFSYSPPPTQKQLKHLEGKRMNFIIETIKNIVFTKRTVVFIITGLFIVGCVFGIIRMKTSGRLVDDIKKSNSICIDLAFFEKNFGGVMPFEISIDTKKKNGVMKLSTIQKIDEVQKVLAKNPKFSRSLSLAEFVKFAKQSFYNGDPEFYDLPNNNEQVFILSYLPKIKGKKNMLHSFIDSTKRYTRISVQMADVGTTEMRSIESQLRPSIDSIFDPQKYEVTITGNSVVYTKGTDFLIRNLWESVLIGIIIISIIIAIAFRSTRMVIIAMICNLIPLLITAAIMGYGGIPVKPSTLIVFSVALGIAIDNAILFLSKVKSELWYTAGDLKLAVALALDEAGVSMIYTSIVLVLGFGIFMLSAFGGTQALGMLISLSLFLALFFNIIVLPSLVMVLKKI